MQKFLSVAALGVVLALPAQAVTTASISTGPLLLGLADLNASDATAPSFQWGSDWIFNTISNDATQTGWHVQNLGWGNALWADWPALQGLSQSALNQNQLSSTSALGYGSMLLQGSSAGLQNMQSSVSVQAGQQGLALTYYDRDFVLGAYTQLTFSVMVNGAVANDGSTTPWALPAGIASVDTRSHAYGDVAMYVGDLNKRTGIGGLNTWLAAEPFEVSADGDSLRFTIKNSSAQDKPYHLTMLTSVQAYETTNPISAVPEPSALALMTLGLLAVAGMARSLHR